MKFIKLFTFTQRTSNISDTRAKHTHVNVHCAMHACLFVHSTHAKNTFRTIYLTLIGVQHIQVITIQKLHLRRVHNLIRIPILPCLIGCGVHSQNFRWFEILPNGIMKIKYDLDWNVLNKTNKDLISKFRLENEGVFFNLLGFSWSWWPLLSFFKNRKLLPLNAKIASITIISKRNYLFLKKFRQLINLEQFYKNDTNFCIIW